MACTLSAAFRTWLSMGFTYLYYLQLYQQFFSVLCQEQLPAEFAPAAEWGWFQSRRRGVEMGQRLEPREAGTGPGAWKQHVSGLCLPVTSSSAPKSCLLVWPVLNNLGYGFFHHEPILSCW